MPTGELHAVEVEGAARRGSGRFLRSAGREGRMEWVAVVGDGRELGCLGYTVCDANQRMDLLFVSPLLEIALLEFDKGGTKILINRKSCSSATE